MIACPSCKRRVVTRRDILCATLDGGTRCRVCDQVARFDPFSRRVIASMLAIVLPPFFLSSGAFFSGHVFLLAMLGVFGGWRIIAAAGLPLLVLEAVPGNASLDRSQSILVLAVMLVFAMTFDGIMFSRFDAAGTL